MLTFVTLRQATVSEVQQALRECPFAGWPHDEDELLTFFNIMLNKVMIDAETREVISRSEIN
ncbi:hypothetical protein [Novosphingobium soli]|uniref:Uncharacterized protein n=1 Tax=Novosphingobium soli TaxID=574956 RepID=A0ABV6D1F0_9SPHN